MKSILGLSHRALNLLKLTNKRKVRIPLLCLKVKTGQLPAIDSLTYPENQNNKVYSNKRPKMEPTVSLMKNQQNMTGIKFRKD